MHILVISLYARHSKNLECSKPVQGLKQLALAHKSVCINWRLHSQGFCGVFRTILNTYERKQPN